MVLECGLFFSVTLEESCVWRPTVGLKKMLLGDPGEMGGGTVAEYIYIKKKNLTMTMGTNEV